MTVPMFNPDNGKTADVHEDEVATWNKIGWRLVGEIAAEPDGDADIEDLRKQADKSGVVIDKRWGPKRLREEIAKVRAA